MNNINAIKYIDEDDEKYFSSVEFKFEQDGDRALCTMGKIQSYIPNRSIESEIIRNELMWSNIKCYLKQRWGKEYYKKYYEL